MSTGLLAALIIAAPAALVLAVLLVWARRGRGRHSDKQIL